MINSVPTLNGVSDVMQESGANTKVVTDLDMGPKRNG